MTYKPFSRDLYKENNKKAIETACSFLLSVPKRTKLELRVPLEKQREAFKDRDFFLFRVRDGKRIDIEAEIKKVWKVSGKWQGWPTIDVPGRKKDSKAQIFIMINNNDNTLAVANMKDVVSSPVSNKVTAYTDDEPFFNVSLNKFAFYYWTNEKWKRIDVNGKIL